MDKRFLTAFLQPKKTEIFGYKLDPLCYRHLLILEFIKSPYLSFSNDNTVPSAVDTIKFLKICSTKTWEEAFDKKISDKINLILLNSSIFDFAKVNQKIVTYMQDSFSIPKLWTKIDDEGNNKKLSKSFHQSIMTISILISKFNFTEEEAWNMSISKAAWYTTAFAKLEGGDIDVIKTSEEETAKQDLDKLKKLEQEAIKYYSKVIKNRKIKT